MDVQIDMCQATGLATHTHTLIPSRWRIGKFSLMPNWKIARHLSSWTKSELYYESCMVDHLVLPIDVINCLCDHVVLVQVFKNDNQHGIDRAGLIR